MSVIIFSFFVLPFAWQTAQAEDNVSGMTGAVLSSNIKPGEDLEKIPAPQFINFYRSIRKIGNALWGVKKDNKSEDSKLSSASGSAVGKVKELKMEKIPTPQQISQYSNIQRKGKALWGIKKRDAYVAVTAEQSACVISAIESKDKAVIENRGQELKTLTDLINSRGVCQKSALASIDNQKENLEKCAEIFKSSNKELRLMTQKLQAAIWQTYKESLTACSNNSVTATSSGQETKSLIMIEDGDEAETTPNSSTNER